MHRCCELANSSQWLWKSSGRGIRSAVHPFPAAENDPTRSKGRSLIFEIIIISSLPAARIRSRLRVCRLHLGGVPRMCVVVWQAEGIARDGARAAATGRHGKANTIDGHGPDPWRRNLGSKLARPNACIATIHNNRSRHAWPNRSSAHSL